TIPSETVKVDDNGQIQLKHGAVQTMSIGRSTNAGNAYIKGTDTRGMNADDFTLIADWISEIIFAIKTPNITDICADIRQKVTKL
ncbi:hypothetical protein MJM99_31955, partial [Salmonella enterica subsp. enterica serovar Kentucky]|nr:hypothetical protein [Salmonella enterica subsp. enterica serovar Kentucky]